MVNYGGVCGVYLQLPFFFTVIAPDFFYSIITMLLIIAIALSFLLCRSNYSQKWRSYEHKNNVVKLDLILVFNFIYD